MSVAALAARSRERCGGLDPSLDPSVGPSVGQGRRLCVDLPVMLDRNRAADLAALLDWYREMGAGEAVGETAIDWLARGDRVPGHGFRPPGPPQAAVARPAPAQREPTSPVPAVTAAAPARRPAPQPVAPRQFPAAPPDAAVLAARTSARQ